MSKTQNELKQLADNLPPMVQADKNGRPLMITREYYGQSLIDQGIRKVNNGSRKEKVNPKKKYHRAEPVQVDHLRELTIRYRKAGWSGVHKYISDVEMAMILQDANTKQQPRGKKIEAKKPSLFTRFINRITGKKA